MGIFSILNGISKTQPRPKLQKSAKCLHSFITNKTTLSKGKLSAKSKVMLICELAEGFYFDFVSVSAYET